VFVPGLAEILAVPGALTITIPDPPDEDLLEVNYLFLQK
jgi:hypothetical protein